MTLAEKLMCEAGLLRRFVAESGITDLSDYTLYSSFEPCYMFAGAYNRSLISTYNIRLSIKERLFLHQIRTSGLRFYA